MGSSEMEKSDKEKEPKTPPPPSSSASASATSQEPSSAVSAGMATPDWSGFQAYSPMPPHGYVASSPQPHPYMWGHMMPPYGTPSHPYVAMYPPGSMYAHPSLPPGSYPYSPYAMPSPNGMPEATGNTGSGIEGDAAKQPEVKEKLPIKRSKGSLGSLNMIIGKNNETGKSSANGACSKSAESASDGSSEGSDANSQNDSGSRHNGKDGETASDSGHGPPRNGSNLPVSQMVPIMPVSATGVQGPPTNLKTFVQTRYVSPAYSPMPPHGYVASSPQPHPYMWGHMMPPYGTPSHPYVAMYPPGSMYAHPSLPPGSYPYSPYAMPSPNGMPEATGTTGSGVEGDAAKQPEVKEKLPIKRSKGSLGSLNMIIGKNNETGKSSANGACSKSAESASDGSSEGSDANSQNDSGSRHNGKDGETASDSGHGPPRNGSNLPVSQMVPIMPVSATGVQGPPTNLKIGMEYWSGHGNVSTTVPGVVVDGSQSQPWLQDERELKRQRRKQSNRESARRSRLRKQAECDELAQRADVLNGENAGLRAEINKLKSQYDELLAENSSLKNRFSSVEGVNLEKTVQEPETSTHEDVAETTHGSYNNSA